MMYRLAAIAALIAVTQAIASPPGVGAAELDVSEPGLYTIDHDTHIIYLPGLTVLLDDGGIDFAIPPKPWSEDEACRLQLLRALQGCTRDHDECMCDCSGPDCMGPPEPFCKQTCDYRAEVCLEDAWGEYRQNCAIGL